MVLCAEKETRKYSAIHQSNLIKLIMVIKYRYTIVEIVAYNFLSFDCFIVTWVTDR